MNVKVNAPSKSHIPSVVQNLVRTGWELRRSPAHGTLARNGQLLTLRSSKHEARLRLFVYKVTESSRGKPDERRIEITSTYKKGLPRKRNYQDVVLGFEAKRSIFVGVDSRRIAHGGPTGNASSFFDREGLNWAKPNEMLIRPRTAKLFPGGVEFHAFFTPSRLAEYFFNVEAIHTGSYTGHGPCSGIFSRKKRGQASLAVPRESAVGDILELESPEPSSRRGRVSDNLILAYELGKAKRLRRAKLSPEQLLEIKRRCEENGQLGEQYVLNYERRRLRRAGKKALATKVRWVSQKSAGEGYDILSFEMNGRERWIEVKATSGKGRVFEMSENEWRTAKEASKKYYIYRVINVKRKPKIDIFCDPRALEAKGLITKSPSGWWIKLL